MGLVMCGYVYMWVCVYVGFVMCGCFDNCVGVLALVICVLVFTLFVLFVLFFCIISFMYIYSCLFCLY